MSELSEKLLQQIQDRASDFDKENIFPDADIADLKKCGYLKIALPESFGGKGLNLAGVINNQRLLAKYAPATALSVAMHQIINTALAALSDSSAITSDQKQAYTQVFEATRADELFALGISEIGNDQHLYDSKTSAVQVAGGYRVTGTKNTVTAAGAFDSLVFHALDAKNGELVYFFKKRDSSMKPAGAWDMQGMRASQSFGITFEDTFIAEENVLWKAKLGDKRDPFIGILAKAFSLIVTSIYLGIGDRAVELATKTIIQRETSTDKNADQDLVARDALGAVAIAVDAAANHLLRIAESPEVAAERPWAIAGAKTVVVAAARQAVEAAQELQGARWYKSGTELERLSRDLQAGDLHPNKPSVARARAADALIG